MSRNTVARLLGSGEAPRYQRAEVGSILDPFKGEVAAMLAEDAKAPATVIIRCLRRLGYAGGITILKEHLAKVRPEHLAARTYQRTSYLPGEIAQVDWWSPGVAVPVGKGAHREVHGLVATLPHSAAHAVVFSFTKTMADYLACLIGCQFRLAVRRPRALTAHPSVLTRPGGGQEGCAGWSCSSLSAGTTTRDCPSGPPPASTTSIDEWCARRSPRPSHPSDDAR